MSVQYKYNVTSVTSSLVQIQVASVPIFSTQNLLIEQEVSTSRRVDRVTHPSRTFSGPNDGRGPSGPHRRGLESDRREIENDCRGIERDSTNITRGW